MKLLKICVTLSVLLLAMACSEEKGPAEKAGAQVDEAMNEAQQMVKDNTEAAQEQAEEAMDEAKEMVEEATDKIEDEADQLNN